MGSWICLIVGLIGGGCIGYVLSRESRAKCVDCLSNEAGRYMAGHRDGYRDGVQMTVELVKKRSEVSVQAWNGKETWNIEKNELERIRAEAVETAYV